jgi:hypothetical protein
MYQFPPPVAPDPLAAVHERAAAALALLEAASVEPAGGLGSATRRRCNQARHALATIRSELRQVLVLTAGD